MSRQKSAVRDFPLTLPGSLSILPSNEFLEQMTQGWSQYLHVFQKATDFRWNQTILVQTVCQRWRLKGGLFPVKLHENRNTHKNTLLSEAFNEKDLPGPRCSLS